MSDFLTPAKIAESIDLDCLDDDLKRVLTVIECQADIDRLVGSYIRSAFESVGIDPEPFATLAGLDECNRQLEKLGIESAKIWWIQFLSKMIVDRTEFTEDHQSLCNGLRDRLPFYDIEMTIIERVGSQLEQLMLTAGTGGIVKTLFSDDIMARWYKQSTTYDVFNKLSRQVVAELVESHRESSMRILEVGSGTGGLTTNILDLFSPKRTQYVFTDVGAFFLRFARRAFADYAFLEFQRFDLEQPAEPQGFATGSFDLVIANNVVHDTRNVRFSLASVAKLLRPGGMFLLVELTDPQIWWPMCFGSLEGFWRYKSDPDDFRTDSMLLPRERWLELLAEAGFQQSNVISDCLPCDFANRVILSQIARDLP